MPNRVWTILALGAVGLLSGCFGGTQYPIARLTSSGSPEQGRAAIQQFRCGKCHMIPGVPNANGVVGPPLNHMASRTFIAGEFPNNPQNLIHWVASPTSMKPKTLMPDLGLTEEQATNVARYLETLQ